MRRGGKSPIRWVRLSRPALCRPLTPALNFTPVAYGAGAFYRIAAQSAIRAKRALCYPHSTARVQGPYAVPLGHCRRPAIAAAQVICTFPVMANCGLRIIHAVPPLAVSISGLFILHSRALVARQVHTLQVSGSIPACATMRGLRAFHLAARPRQNGLFLLSPYDAPNFGIAAYFYGVRLILVIIAVRREGRRRYCRR